jgi:outer membrane protein OmpA-like peptidoglycan-associated protein/WD40 repeat protein
MRSLLAFCLVLAVFISSCREISAQIVSVCSGNSKLLAVATPEGKVRDTLRIGGINVSVATFFSTQIRIYDIKNLSCQHILRFLAKKKSPVNEVGFSADLSLFFARSRLAYKVWNLKSGLVVKDFPMARNFAFATSGNQYLVKTNKGLVLFANGKDSLAFYKFAQPTVLSGLLFSADNKYVAASSSDGNIYLWKTDSLKLLRAIPGSNFLFTKETSALVVNNQDAAYTSVISLPQLREVKKINWNYIVEIKRRDDLLKSNLNRANALKYPRELIASKTTLSPDGRFLLISTLKNRAEEGLIILETLNNSEIIAIDARDYLLYPSKFLNDSLLAIASRDHYSILFNVSEKRFIQDLSLKLKFEKGEKTISEATQMRYRKLSPDYKYVVLQGLDKKAPVLYFRPTLIEQEKNVLNGVSFLCFSPDSKLIFTLDKTEKVSVVKTADIETQFESQLKSYYFVDSVGRIPVESELLDANPPLGYFYMRMKDLRHIGTMNDTSFVKIYAKTLGVHEEETQLQVQLYDHLGNFYYGAGDPKYRKIWCNFTLRSPGGKIQKIENFEVEEHNSFDSLPTAMAIIMDHSGSMGDRRAFVLQNGAAHFIGGKRKNDAIAILKYDEKIGIESPFTTQKDELLNNLKRNGVEGFGGSTSLVDAINEGVRLLKDLKSFGKKTIVILTDGNENSSVLPKNVAIKNAIRNNINVFTIGFGDYVSEEYLKGLSFNTEGSFYQIYKTADFNWIFSDIDKKMRNFYTLKFKTKDFGDYLATVEICFEKKKMDSLSMAFNNMPVNIDSINDYDESAFKSRLLNVSEFLQKDSLLKTGFLKLNFPEILFNAGGIQIVLETEKGINEIVAYLLKNITITIEIGGHTDNLGDEADNFVLSQQRADVVKGLLVKAGISADRIVTKGYGASRPVTSNKTEDGKAKNRRVEFLILKQ